MRAEPHYQVAVLGAGYAGLGAALRLSDLGLSTILLEAAPTAGGLGGCLEVGGHLVESFYHHIKPEDVDLLALIERLGLGPELSWRRTVMGFYTAGRFQPFSSPLDLLRYAGLAPADRVAFGLGILRARQQNTKDLIGRDAESWIVETWNARIYHRLLKPMLTNKFVIPPREVSAAFIHGRIVGLSSTKSNVRRGESFAYLNGSMQRLTERLAAAVAERVELRTRAPVEHIAKSGDGTFSIQTPSGTIRAERVINTLAIEAFRRIPKSFGFESAITYQAAVCGIFAVRGIAPPFYWTNIIDPEVSFRVLINQSALADYGDTTILYCGNYTPASSDLFAMSDHALLATYERDLRRLCGDYAIVDSRIARSRVATPIFDVTYGAKMDQLDRATPGLFFAGSANIFPGTRTLSSVFRTGREAADKAAASLPSPALQAVAAA